MGQSNAQEAAWFKNKVTKVQTHKTGMDLHDQRQDVIRAFGEE